MMLKAELKTEFLLVTTKFVTNSRCSGIITGKYKVTSML